MEGSNHPSMNLSYYLHPCNHHWRGGTRRPTKDGPKTRQIGWGHTSPHLWWVAILGPLDGSCRVSRHLELIWYGLWPFLFTWLGPDLPSLLGLLLLGSYHVMLCLVLCVLLTHFLWYHDMSSCNWWITKTRGTLLVMTKFGVHLDGFYINVGS